MGGKTALRVRVNFATDSAVFDLFLLSMVMDLDPRSCGRKERAPLGERSQRGASWCTVLIDVYKSVGQVSDNHMLCLMKCEVRDVCAGVISNSGLSQTQCMLLVLGVDQGLGDQSLANAASLQPVVRLHL